ncbi:MAG: hypothetical protein IPN33_00060 [Saprospiraceae bacterium]|nr:hypothetical protein [Saprospiraceae bacterium]
MKKINKLFVVIILIISFGCKQQNNEPDLKEEHHIDSVMEDSGEMVRDANEGIKQGFEESKEELKEKAEELLTDTIPH